MGELFKTQHTIDEMLDRMGVKIVLDTDHLSEDDVLEAEKSGSSVVLKKKRSEKVEKKLKTGNQEKNKVKACFLLVENYPCGMINTEMLNIFL